MRKYVATLAVALIPLLTMGIVHQPSEATDQAHCDAAAHAQDTHGIIVWCRAAAEDYDIDAASESGDEKAASLYAEATGLVYVAIADYILNQTNHRPTGDSVCVLFQTAQSLYSKAQESATRADLIRIINDSKVSSRKLSKDDGWC